MDKNGYFKVSTDKEGTYITFIQPEGNGKTISLDNLIKYLEKKKIEYGAVADLKNAYEEAMNGGKVKISSNPILPFSGWCEYSNQNYMAMIMIMFPECDGFVKTTKQDILKDLKNMKVVYGIDEVAIDKMITEGRYYEPVIIAKATPAIDGHDAVLNYNFNTKVVAKPTINEDGTVDFHQLDMISHINAGDVVAEIIPEDLGQDGTNIIGAPIKPKKVIKKVFKHGRNLVVSEDGCKLISQVTGHVTLEGDKIFVSDEYDVKTDVDTSTGDITYDGNVHVRGSVRAGFKINATGNVNIDGVVEGADIVAGGDIVLAKGIQGMNKGTLHAKGSIISTFIENATAIADKNLEADAILHSKVTVGGSIEVHGKNGYIIGGQVRAGSIITAKNIGSTMGTNTVLAVGTNPELTAKIDEVKKKLTSATQDRIKLNQVVDLLKKKLAAEGKLDRVKMDYLQKSLENIKMLNEQIEEAKMQYTELSSMVCEDTDAKIKVMGSIYPGTKLEFGDQSMFIRDKNDFCQYVKKGADIVRGNM